MNSNSDIPFVSAGPREASPADGRWESYVKEPLQVGNPDAQHWDDQADVVVVGFGGAGVCAALEARAHGMDVLAVERFGGGGATTLSGGIYYGGGTRFQQAGGHADSAEEMYRYLKMEVGDTILDATLRRFCDESNANLEWLITHGLQFGGAVYDGKRSYPPAGFDLYYSGNEKVARYKAQAKAAPRGHRVVGQKYTGNVFYEGLRRSALEKGVRLLDHAPVSRLIVDAQGAVIGVEVNRIPPDSPAWKEHVKLIGKVNKWQRYFAAAALKTGERVAALEREHGKPVRIRARQGVVLCTGSFVFNRAMVRQYAPKYAQAMPLGTLGCDGSGIRLGQSLGGMTDCMESVTAWRSISPPITFVQGMVVNAAGQRFINEDAYLGHLGRAVADQDGGRAWVIIDRKAHRASFAEAMPRRGEAWHEFGLPLLMNLLSAQKGASLEALARRCGIAPEGLARAAQAYNTAAGRGDDELGKNKEYLRPLGDGPFYAIDVSVGSTKFPCPSITMGGLMVDEETGLVLRADGTRIAGLYAAGRAAKGIPAGFYVSGTSIADCVFSGRRAGLHAAGKGVVAPAAVFAPRASA